VTPRVASRIQDPAEIAGRRSELSPWQARDHPLGEEHVSAGTVLGSVHGREHGQLQKPVPLIRMTLAIPGAAHRNQVTAEKAGQHSELSPWQVRAHPFGEEHVSAGTALGSVYGGKEGTQTLPHPKGLMQKNTPHMMRESDKRVRAQAGRGGRGRVTTRRPTLFHSVEQESINFNRLNAS